MTRYLIVLFALYAFPAHGESDIIAGQAVTIDGDTIDIGTRRIRLHGVDAPEIRGERVSPAGFKARDFLLKLVFGKRIICLDTGDRDVSWGTPRIIAQCHVKTKEGWRDIARVLVRAGHARQTHHAKGWYQ